MTKEKDEMQEAKLVSSAEYRNQIKHEWDASTVGLLLCKSHDKTVVEYALANTERPMGVAQYERMKTPPEELRVTAASIARLAAVVDETYAQMEKETRPSASWRSE